MPPEEASDPARHFHAGHRLITWRPRGVLDDSMADEILAFIEGKEESELEPFNRFTDFSKLDEIQLKFGHMFNLASRRRMSTANRSSVKSAFFSNTVVGFGIARMYETLMEGSTIQVRVFRDLTAIAEWLSVPKAILNDEK
jgi:hypothetical protein